MFDQLTSETDAKVRFRNGRSVYGVILGHQSEIENMKFVPNHFLGLYKATEDPQFIITLDESSVRSVDLCLK